MLTSIALIGWIPVVLVMFAAMPPRRAVIWAFLVAWLFLPMSGFGIAGLPDYTKMSATSVGVLLGVLIFDTRRLSAFRPSAIDTPMIVYCLCPLASSLSNGLGWYDGIAQSLNMTMSWGVPYSIGRLYFRQFADLRELAIAIFVGGLIYVPLCLYEIRMSPQLHKMAYGFMQHNFRMHIRYDGYRPMVFMQSGLMVGLWMCMTGLIGVWLWRCRVLTTFLGLPMGLLVLPLLATAVLCKSTGAIVLLLVGAGALFAAVVLRTRFALVVLVAAVPLYMGVRAAGAWGGDEVVALSASVFGKERAGSLALRLRAENALLERARQRPLLGWGGWGRNRVRNAIGQNATAIDGHWILTLGTHGWVGAASWCLSLLLPVAIVLWRLNVRRWSRPEEAPAIAIAAVITMYALDCLPNAMENPVFTVCLGGLASLGVVLAKQCAATRPIGKPIAQSTPPRVRATC